VTLKSLIGETSDGAFTVSVTGSFNDAVLAASGVDERMLETPPGPLTAVGDVDGDELSQATTVARPTARHTQAILNFIKNSSEVLTWYRRVNGGARARMITELPARRKPSCTRRVNIRATMSAR
jgi:hypothetical protein